MLPTEQYLVQLTGKQSSILLKLILKKLCEHPGITARRIAQRIKSAPSGLSKAINFADGTAHIDISARKVKELLSLVVNAYTINVYADTEGNPSFSLPTEIGSATWKDDEAHWYAYIYWQKTNTIGSALWCFTPNYNHAVLEFLNQSRSEVVHQLTGPAETLDGTCFADICGKHPQDRSMVCLHFGGRPLDKKRVLHGTYTGARARDRALVAGAVLLLPYLHKADAMHDIVQNQWPAPVQKFISSNYFALPPEMIHSTDELNILEKL